MKLSLLILKIIYKLIIYSKLIISNHKIENLIFFKATFKKLNKNILLITLYVQYIFYFNFFYKILYIFDVHWHYIIHGIK